MRAALVALALLWALGSATPAVAWVETTPTVLFGATTSTVPTMGAIAVGSYSDLFAWPEVGLSFTHLPTWNARASQTGTSLGTVTALGATIQASIPATVPLNTSYAVVMFTTQDLWSLSGDDTWWVVGRYGNLSPSAVTIPGVAVASTPNSFATYRYLTYGDQLDVRAAESGVSTAPASLWKGHGWFKVGSTATVFAARAVGGTLEWVTYVKDDTKCRAGQDGGRSGIVTGTVNATMTANVLAKIQANATSVVAAAGPLYDRASTKLVDLQASGLSASATTTDAAEVDLVFSSVAAFDPDLASIVPTEGLPVPPEATEEPTAGPVPIPTELDPIMDLVPEWLQGAVTGVRDWFTGLEDTITGWFWPYEEIMSW